MTFSLSIVGTESLDDNISTNPIIRDFYQRQLAAGKPKKLVLTACMRKLLTILTACRKTVRRGIQEPRLLDTQDSCFLLNTACRKTVRRGIQEPRLLDTQDSCFLLNYWAAIYPDLRQPLVSDYPPARNNLPPPFTEYRGQTFPFPVRHRRSFGPPHSAGLSQHPRNQRGSPLHSDER